MNFKYFGPASVKGIVRAYLLSAYPRVQLYISPVNIDPPSVQMQFSINDGPFVGRDGKHVQSRVIHDRLFREMKTNVSIHVEDSDFAGVFNVSARGAMH